MTGEWSRNESRWDADVPFNASPLSRHTRSSANLFSPRFCSTHTQTHNPVPYFSFVSPPSLLSSSATLFLSSSCCPLSSPTSVSPFSLLVFLPQPLQCLTVYSLRCPWVLKQQRSVRAPLITAPLTTIEGDFWWDETRVPEKLAWPACIGNGACLVFYLLSSQPFVCVCIRARRCVRMLMCRKCSEPTGLWRAGLTLSSFRLRIRQKEMLYKIDFSLNSLFLCIKLCKIIKKRSGI